MKAGIWFLAAALAALPARAGDWQAVEQIKSYPVSGQTGAELYEAIGRNGPEISLGMRTIAHTSFKLTWRRNYEPQGGNCVLVSAVPKLIITYVLPKPKGKLPAALQPHWQRFYEGVRAHEKVHGDYIRDLVHAIEAGTIGLTVPDDPGCTKIKAEMTKRLGALSQTQRQRSRDFDRVEMSEGGNIQQLVLGLVNSR
ncbi:DUF922 domain-containing protein [Rhizobium sp. YJ-22]|uniref:DUF922 domain-containing Zn-dependent protease n=1 Tax=Rhizobium sp. YJ-22 TaxID=3037556 RepID=UPI00241275EC|nr:DUF922 domain-containing protein [Rhizobium sp. YJ-22]MDG3574798.1 DUF922 domain-containing protein [Rhizobium sp. YJ-22]